MFCLSQKGGGPEFYRVVISVFFAEHIEKGSAGNILLITGIYGFHTCVTVEYLESIQIQDKDWIGDVTEN